MGLKHKTGSAPVGGEARAFDQLAGTIDAKATPHVIAEQAIAEMIANGATFKAQRRDDGLASFIFEVAGGGDRERCREIVRQIKARPDAWSVMIHMVSMAL